MVALSIPDAEIADRIRETQRRMDEEGLSALLCFGAHRDYAPADLWYLARWSCIDEETSYVFVPSSGDTVLITDAEWDLERARAEAAAGEIVLDRDPEAVDSRPADSVLRQLEAVTEAIDHRFDHLAALADDLWPDAVAWQHQNAEIPLPGHSYLSA